MQHLKCVLGVTPLPHSCDERRANSYGEQSLCWRHPHVSYREGGGFATFGIATGVKTHSTFFKREKWHTSATHTTHQHTHSHHTRVDELITESASKRMLGTAVTVDVWDEEKSVGESGTSLSSQTDEWHVVCVVSLPPRPHHTSCVARTASPSPPHTLPTAQRN
jgi:hypothetical protein